MTENKQDWCWLLEIDKTIDTQERGLEKQINEKEREMNK